MTIQAILIFCSLRENQSKTLVHQQNIDSSFHTSVVQLVVERASCSNSTEFSRIFFLEQDSFNLGGLCTDFFILFYYTLSRAPGSKVDHY